MKKLKCKVHFVKVTNIQKRKDAIKLRKRWKQGEENAYWKVNPLRTICNNSNIASNTRKTWEWKYWIERTF